MRSRTMWLPLALLISSAVSIPARAVVEAYEIVSATTATDSAGTKTAEVECPPDTLLLGGGALVFGSAANKALVASQPLLDFSSGQAIGWEVEANEVFADATSWAIQASAACGNVPGLERVGDATVSDSSTLKDLVVECPVGKRAISGGFEIGGATAGISFYQSAPDDLGAPGFPLGWQFGAIETVATDSNWSLRGQVLCADLDALLFQAATAQQRNEQFRELTLECPAGYVALGGGGRLGGAIVDWIDTSAPVFSGTSWRVGFQRPTSQLGQNSSTLSYRVVCPEPTAALQGLLALASVVGLGRRRNAWKRG